MHPLSPASESSSGILIWQHPLRGRLLCSGVFDVSTPNKMHNLGEKQELSGHGKRSESFPKASSLPWQTAAGERLSCNTVTLFSKCWPSPALHHTLSHTASHLQQLWPQPLEKQWNDTQGVLHEMPRSDWVMQNCLQNCLVEALCFVLQRVSEHITAVILLAFSSRKRTPLHTYSPLQEVPIVLAE